MSRAQLSMYVWTLHLSFAGIVLLCTPTTWFTWVGLRDPGDTMWVRLSGMLMGIMGYYFYAAARSDNREFMQWGIKARMAPIFFLASFVAFQLENPWIVSFGLLDIATGLWTAWAMKRDLRDQTADEKTSELGNHLSTSSRPRFAALVAMAAILPVTSNVTANENLESILQKVNQQAERLGNVQFNATLNVLPKTGSPREFQLALMIRRDTTSVRSHVRVTAPAAMANMQFVRNQLGPSSDELLLYVPTTKQVQHVSASGQQRKFLNSDFTFGDLNVSPQGLVEAKVVESSDSHWVIAAKPPVPQTIEWILFTVEKEDYAISRVCFYGPAHKMIKDLNVREWKAFDGVRWPMQLEMRDLTSLSTSIIKIEDIKTNLPADAMPTSIFTASHLLTR